MPATYDTRSKRFRSPGGRLIPERAISTEVDKAVARSSKRLRLLGRQLAAGKLSLPEWQLAARAEIKLLHTTTAAIGRGGWRNMTLSDWGRTGAEIRSQYAYHNRFARDIEAGRVSPAQVEYRNSLYAKPARNGYHNNRLREAVAGGQAESRRVLHATESCEECAAWARRGWIPTAEQPAIGSLKCKQNCRCTVEYRTRPASEG